MSAHNEPVERASEPTLIADYVVPEIPEDALLGLATTRQLLHELAVRFKITNPNEWACSAVTHMLQVLPDETLDYRTADPCPAGGSMDE